MRTFLTSSVYAWLIFLSVRVTAAPFVDEEFATDPVASNRFEQVTFGTESSFTHNQASQNLTAILDVDYDPAYYLSTPFAPITASADASFSVNFRVAALDNRVLPTAFFGFLTTNHVNLNGDGLTLVITSLTNGQPAFGAAVFQASGNSGGETIPLALGTDYLAIGRYLASSRQFIIEVYGGVSFTNLAGRSTAYATNSPILSLNRIGLQNNGGTSFDYSNGSITLVVDNVYVPARPPVNLSVVTNVAVYEGDSGITNALFAVSLSSPSVQTVRVDYATVSMTATPGVDFVPQAGTLVFPPGTNSLNIVIPVAGDVLAEPDETFKVVLTNILNASLVIAEGIGTIRNDDLCAISINDTGVAEVSSGATNAVFTVSLSLSNSQAVSVRFGVSDFTATLGSDYVTTNGLLIFPPGMVTQVLAVSVLGDLIDEPDEVFFVNLDNATNAILGRAQGQCVITNTSPLPTVYLDAATSIVEGDLGITNVQVAFHLTPLSGKFVQATFATVSGTATAESDYLATTNTVNFNAGQTNVTTSIAILPDRLHEGTQENFQILLISASNAVIGNGTETVSIIDDDPVPSVVMTDTGVVEGNVGATTAGFVVHLSNPTINPVTVNYTTTNGTAVAGSDYVATNGILTWLPGTTNPQSIAVAVIGDTLNEPDEVFGLLLTVSNTNASIARPQAFCTITNDDLVALSISDAQVFEGNGGAVNMQFTVSLSGASFQPVSVGYFTRDDTANAGADYLQSSGILDFNAPNTTQAITVTVLGDLLDEPDEKFNVVLTNLVNATYQRQLAVGTILDDDSPAINISSVLEYEGNSNTTAFVFPVTLSSTTTNLVTVNYSTINGDATAGSDFIATNGSTSFPPGVVSNNIVVFVIGDTNFEADEIFSVNLSAPSGATLGSALATGLIVNDDPPPFLYISNVVVVEGTCTNFQMTLSATSSLPVLVIYCLSALPSNVFLVCGTNCTATEPTNLPPECRSLCCLLRIPPGVISANFQICAEHNGVDEPDAAGRGSGRPVGGGGQVPPGGATNQILYYDIDPPTLVSDDAGILEGNSGLTNLCFTLRLTTPAGTNVSVDFRTVDSGARAGIDYLATNGTFVFPPGVTSRSFCVPIIGDIIYETNELFLVLLTNAINAVITNATIRGIVINDDLPPALTVSDLSVVEGNSGTTQAVITVNVLSPTELGIAVDFAVTDMTATSGLDYFATNGVLFFNPGTTNLTIPVVVVGDALDEPNEIFAVRLNNPDPVTATLLKTNGIVTIIDDDPPEIRVSNPSVAEGNSGTTNLLFVVTLSTTNAIPVTVEFMTVGDTASAGADFVSTNGVLTFLPGESSKTIPVTVVGDALTEVNETMFLNLTNAPNATLPFVRAIGTILDDDAPCLSISNVVVQELPGGPADAAFLVTLDHPSTLPISVDFSTLDGSAIVGNDYLGRSGSLVFSNGITSQSIHVQVNNDLEVEVNETFLVALSNGVNVNFCNMQGTATILDGTVPPVITVSQPVVAEGGVATTNAIFAVTLNRPSQQAVTFEFATATGTAVSGTDFLATTGTVTFLANTTSNHIAVPVIGDCSFEADENFFINLTNAQFAVLATSFVRGTIVNDDPLPVVFVDGFSLLEGDSGTTNAVLSIRLSCASAFTASVQYATVNGTATAGSDYVATNGTVSFTAGQTNATILIPVLGDYGDESDEYFFVSFSAPTTASLATNQAAVTIINDDGILIRISPARAAEGSFAQFPVTLSKPPSSGGITVNYTTLDDPTALNLAAIAGQDYDATNGVLNFAAGSTNADRTIDVFLRPDTVDEPNEVFQVLLSNPVHATLETNRAVGTILDDDPPCILVQDTAITDDGSGNQNARFVVLLSSTSSVPICVSYYTTNSTAIAGPDYIATSGLLCFPPGTTNGEILVKVLPNTVFETNEFFFVVMANPTNAAVCKEKGTSTIVNPLVNNLPPLVSLASPDAGACLSLPTNLTLLADASDLDGKVNRVEFFDRSAKIGEAFDPPFAINWFNVTQGQHVLTAVALDNVGATATSAPVLVTASMPAALSVDDRAVLEGNTGITNIVFTVSLASPSCRTVSTTVVTISDTAAAGTDFQNVAKNLTFYPNETQKAIAVGVLGDTAIEPDERFYLVITNEANASVIKRIGEARIINDDTNLAPFVSIVDPVSNATFYTPPGVVRIVANAQDLDGFIREVEFYASDVFLGRSTNNPFTLPWTNGPIGLHDLKAVAIDNSLARATSAPVRISIVPCSDILSATPLRAQTACACGNVTFSTTVTCPDPVTFIWRLNGRLIPGQTGNTLSLQGVTAEYAGLYSVEVSSPCRTVTNSALLNVQGENLPNPILLTYSNSITINAVGPATPSPSVVNAQCVLGPVKDLTVTLSGLTHSFVGDLDIALVSPSLKAIKLMSDLSDAGVRAFDVTNLSLTFSLAGKPLPEFGELVAGVYLPKDDVSNDGDDALPVPVGTVFTTNLADFVGSEASGAWRLYVQDDQFLDDGRISDGWTLTIWWTDSGPQLTSPIVRRGQGFQFTVTGQLGSTHSIVSSTDLVHWQLVTNVFMTNPSMQVILPNEPNGPLRFFRAQRCFSPGPFQGTPARLTSPKYLGDGLFQAVIMSSAGRTHVIETSSDLQNWTRVSTNYMNAAEKLIVVPGPTSPSHRFYRAVEP